MKKILAILTFFALQSGIAGRTLTLTAAAQTVRQMKVYIKGGLVDRVPMGGEASVGHSRADLNGVVHDDYVSMVVKDAEGRERQYLISQLDSLVMPNGRRVVFRGYTNVNSSPERAVVSPRQQPRRTSFSGSFPGQGTGNVTFYWTEYDRIRLDDGSVSRATRLTADRTGADFVFDDAEFESPEYIVYYPDRTVTIASQQSQTGADNSAHIGPSGDCATATATIDTPPSQGGAGGGSYSFTLEHKVAYLCFLPRIDHLPSVRVTQIDVSCSSAIAGTYEMTPSGLYNGTNTSTKITLALNRTPQQENDFFLGHVTSDAQRMCGSYMVVVPQGSAQTFTVTYHLTDTLSRLATTYKQTLDDFKPVANTVYPVTCNIPESLFRTVDLGYDYLWSSVNYGSNLPNEAGTFYTHEAMTSALDAAWNLPGAEATSELLDKCSWTWGTYNGTDGWFVEGTNNGNDDIPLPRIFLPLNGYNNGNVNGDIGYYWLAADEADPEGEAQALQIGQTADSRQTTLMNSSLALNARPVKAVDREFRIPYSGTQTIDLRTHGPGYSIKVYDHAGPDQDYSNGADGYLHIICAEGYKLNVSGSVATEGDCDPFRVYDHTYSGDIQVASYGGSTTANATSKTNDVLLYFHSDGSNVRSGLNLTVTIQRQLTNYNVEIAEVEGGTLMANTYNANPEDTIILTATPAEGYVLSHINVTTDDKVLTLYDEDPRLFKSPSSATLRYVMCDTVRVRQGDWWHDTSYFRMPYGDVTITPVFVRNGSVREFLMAGNGTDTIRAEYVKRLVDAGVRQFTFYDYCGKNSTSYDENVNSYMRIFAPTGYRMTLSGVTRSESGYDYLNVYDPYLGTNWLIKSLSGYNTYSGITSITPYNYQWYLYFRTDGGKSNYDGFEATITIEADTVSRFNMLKDASIYLPEEHILQLLAAGKTSVTIYDDGGPNGNYDADTPNSWCYITLPEGWHAQVHGSYALETNYDYIDVLDNGVTTVSKTGSGTLNSPVLSHNVSLHLRGDGSRSSSGFALTVEFIAPTPSGD